ncbi:MAG: hypothetical protein ABEH56_07335 [Salinirussus sp.]
MAERDRQVRKTSDTTLDGQADPDSDADLDLGVGIDRITERDRDGDGDAGRTGLIRGRFRSVLGRVLSLRGMVVAVVLSALGVILLGGILPFGTVGDLLGVSAGAFLYGLLGRRGRYVETAAAGGVVAGGATLLDTFVLTLFGVGVPVVGLGISGGVLTALLGHFLGRDLRDGLTREL